MNILTKEFDFEIANWYYKKILHQTVITNRSITEKSLNSSFFIFLVVDNYISFMEIKNVIKYLLSLNYQ